MKSGRAPLLLRLVGAVVLAMVLTSCGGEPEAPQQEEVVDVPVGAPTVIAEIPHDPTAFTEGFVFDGPALYESTGLFGKSQLRELNPATGAVIRSASLPPDFFGEGIAVVGDKIWQLTYQNGVAIEWDKATFTQIRQVPMEGEGWGLCYDGERLIRSDGTDKLRFHDPTSFAETGSVSVTYRGAPLTRINELECVDGQVWANVSPIDQILRIDPTTGKVTEVIGAPALLNPAIRVEGQTLNGIAYAGNGEYLLTGKNWPSMFRVRFDSVGQK